MSPTWRRASGALSPVTNTSALATSAQARVGMSSGSGMEAFTGIQVAGIGSSADRAMSRSCHKAAETSIHHREMSPGRTSSRQIVRVPVSLSLFYSRKTCGTKESEACQGAVRKDGRIRQIRPSIGALTQSLNIVPTPLPLESGRALAGPPGVAGTAAHAVASPRSRRWQIWASPLGRDAGPK